MISTETKKKRRFKVSEEVENLIQSRQLPQPLHTVHIPETIEIIKIQSIASPRFGDVDLKQNSEGLPFNSKTKSSKLKQFNSVNVAK
jgi:hypothetical protein